MRKDQQGQEKVDPTYFASVEEQELEEEQKMNKFYELLRGFSEVRDYFQRRLQHLNPTTTTITGNSSEYLHQKESEKKITRAQDVHKDEEDEASWVPSFKWEDFKDVDINNSNKKKITNNRSCNDDDDDDDDEMENYGSGNKKRRKIKAVNEDGEQCDDKNATHSALSLDLNLMPL